MIEPTQLNCVLFPWPVKPNPSAAPAFPYLSNLFSLANFYSLFRPSGLPVISSNSFGLATPPMGFPNTLFAFGHSVTQQTITKLQLHTSQNVGSRGTGMKKKVSDRWS